jgi:class 3 adenylate cyclase/CHASE2 domain-containing sensor protein
MKLKPLKRAPVILALAVLVFICGLRLLNLDFFERLERMTYDERARAALHFPAPEATNLAFVSIEESSIAAVKNGYIGFDKNKKVGFQSGLYWPRSVYGRLAEELSDEGAKAVAFDLLFTDLRPDLPPVLMADGSLPESDDYFATQMRRAGNDILATSPQTILPDLFATNAAALGDISAAKDSDGIFRRVRAFNTIRHWHPLFQLAESEYGADLEHAQFTPGKIILPQIRTTNVFTVPVDAQTNFALADFVGNKLPRGMPPEARAFTDERIWHMGIVLAAKELGLDLAGADVDLPQGKITLHGTNGVERIIPVDSTGDFFVDWRIRPNDLLLHQAPIESLLWQSYGKLNGDTNGLRDDFRGKLAIIIYNLHGNNLTDEGATPLDRHTLLAGVHLNVANSIITNRFIQRASLPTEFALIILLGALTAFLTWQLRAFSSLGGVFLLAAIYVAIAFYAFVQFRFWMPLVYPVVGAILMEHLMLALYRVVFEESQKRHVKSIFSKIVSPDIVNELLGMATLSLGGTRQEITVYFADVRGFTEFTDQSQAKVLEFIRENKISGAEADAVINAEAHETLATVNLYLGAIADVIKSHKGTLDKYIGDCVMAFWGAPIPNPKHAVACVRAAIDSQRAVYELNLKRAAENQKRELETVLSGAAARRKAKLVILSLGSGINTGTATVGLMGSREHISNYTVFGREVNLASRLEAKSGRSRIIISEATYKHLVRDDPELAASCTALAPFTDIKGIRDAVKAYEVPWRPPGASPFDEELLTAKPQEGTTFTGIIQREGRS